MDIYKKIAVTLIIAFASYLLYNLWLKRRAILQEESAENFTLLPVIINLGNFDHTAIVTSPTLGNTMSAIAIKQYVIKSSYQSAWDGSTISLDQIAYVLSRGVRYLDFDIFWDKPTTGQNSQAGTFTSVVSYTTSSKYDTTGIPKLAFADVLSFLSQYAFSKANIKNSKNVIYNTPNPDDPLFIHIHVKYPDTNTSSNYRTNLYQSVAGAIATSFTSSQLRIGQPLNCNSSMAEIMKKAIIVFDNKIYPNYLQYTGCQTIPTLPGSLEEAVTDVSCYQLQNYIHLLSESPDMKTLTYGNQSAIKKTPITVPLDESPSNNGYTVKVDQLSRFIPKDPINGSNIDSYNPIQNYSAQILGMMFWKSDGNLSDYEKIFNKFGSAFVPLSKVSKYIEQSFS